MVPDWAAVQTQLILSEEERTQALEALAVAGSLQYRPIATISSFSRAIPTTNADHDISLTIETVQRAQERLEASLAGLRPKTFTPDKATRVHQGKAYKADARLCRSGEVVPLSISLRHASPHVDCRTANLLGFCMGVVKDDDPHVTWDWKGMMEAR